MLKVLPSSSVLTLAFCQDSLLASTISTNSNSHFNWALESTFTTTTLDSHLTGGETKAGKGEQCLTLEYIAYKYLRFIIKSPDIKPHSVSCHTAILESRDRVFFFHSYISLLFMVPSTFIYMDVWKNGWMKLWFWSMDNYLQRGGKKSRLYPSKYVYHLDKHRLIRADYQETSVPAMDSLLAFYKTSSKIT